VVAVMYQDVVNKVVMMLFYFYVVDIAALIFVKQPSRSSSTS
jgi:hypothetical protein